MIRYLLSLIFLSTRATQVWSLSAIQGSPCYDTCNGDVAASAGDIVCTDDDFALTSKGQTLSSCLTCLQTSTYQNGWMTDQILFLYYLSTVQQTCLSGKPAEPISNCTNKCGNLSDAFSTTGGRTFFQSPYTYCSTDSNTYTNDAGGCSTCLQSQQGTVILGNFVQVGEIGCDTQPDVQSGALVYTPDDLFDTQPLSNGSAASTSTTGTATTRPTSTAILSASTRSSAIATSKSTATSSTPAPSSASNSASATSTSASTDSNNNTSTGGKKNSDNDGGGLSRGAAAAIGMALGIIGVAAIVLLALFARRRIAAKQGEAGTFRKMPDTPQSAVFPQMQQLKAAELNRGATPPAAGVFKIPQGAPGAPVVVPKKSKSFKSVASKSIKSLKHQLTPRTSEWFYAANPKHSEDLSALPQKGWD